MNLKQRRINGKRYVIRSDHVHTLELAQERWS